MTSAAAARSSSLVLQPVHRELVVVPTLPAIAPTLHGSAAARNARRRPHTPDAADSDPAKRLERRREGGQPQRRVVGCPRLRGPSDTPPPPPLARTNLGAARPGRGPHGLRPRPRGLQRRATGQSAPHWQPARQLGLRQPHEPKQLPQHRRHPHNPPPDRLRLAGGGREMGDGHRPRRPWRRVGRLLPPRQGHDPGGDREADGGLPHVEGHTPSTQPRIADTAHPAAARPATTTGHIRQCSGCQDDGQRYPARRLILLPPENHRNHHQPPPRSSATTATRATNVRARTSAATSSTSPDPSTSAPPTSAAEPHQQHAADATRTTGGPAPSRAGTPQSPRQERASKRAAQRQPTQHHAATGSRRHLASPARSGALPGPTNTGAVGTQPGQPPGTAHPHRVPAPSPTGSPQPLTPPVAPSHGPRPAASQAATTQAHPEPRPQHGAPDRPAADPTYTPTDNLPTRTHTATPTNATTARPSDAGHPHTHGPTGGLTPRASATSGTEDLPATMHGGPVPQRHHAPPARPPARPAEPLSPGRPAPGPGRGPDPPRTAAPADAPQPADPGGLPEPPPVAGGHARGAPPPADDGAQPPTPPTQPQRDAPAVGAEGLPRSPQRTPTPAPMGNLAGERTKHQCGVPT